MQFSPFASPIPLVFLQYTFRPEILTGSPKRGRQTRKVLENKTFSRITGMRQYLENG